MATGQNSGFHMLDEMVCEAIPGPGLPSTKPMSLGRNAGMSVTDELVFVAPGEVSLKSADEALKSEVARLSKGLAAYITASADPLGTVASARRLLLAELDALEKAASSRG